MAISRSQLVKELEPGLNALIGLEHGRYENQHAEIFDTENSDRAFEEEVMLSGFGQAKVKAEGQAVDYDDAQETFTSRYSHETIALAFAITEEAVEDNLYDKVSSRYTKALARSMAITKQTKGANVLNRGFNSSYTGGDAKEWSGTVPSWADVVAKQAELKKADEDKEATKVSAYKKLGLTDAEIAAIG